ncbi:MAG: hypothetical protein Q9188_002433 [Gyalolechia gomerana]
MFSRKPGVGYRLPAHWVHRSCVVHVSIEEDEEDTVSFFEIAQEAGVVNGACVVRPPHLGAGHDWTHLKESGQTLIDTNVTLPNSGRYTIDTNVTLSDSGRYMIETENLNKDRETSKRVIKPPSSLVTPLQTSSA